MKDSTAIILAIVLVTIIAMPAIFEGVTGGISNLLGELGEWVKYGFGGAGQSQTSLGFNIEYEDGTVDKITPDNLQPLTVKYGGKPIKVVYAYLYYKLTYEQKPESVSGSYTWKRFFDGEEVFIAFTRDITGEVPDSGVWTMCQYHAGCVASKIEELDAGALTSHTIEWEGSVSLDVNYGTGVTEEHFEGTASGTLTVQVEKTATLDVEVRPIACNVITRPLR